MTAIYPEFKGKVAMVSGAASGIGKAAAIAFARNGAHVVVTDIDDAGGKETVAVITAAGGEALFQHCDVADDRENRGAVEFATAQFGGLDYAYNNCGLRSPKILLAETGEDLVDRLLAVNTKGLWSAMRHQIPAMLARGGGAIVNSASTLAFVALEGRSIYSASKAGVVGMSRVAAVEYAARNVRVNVICPGTTETALFAGLLKEYADQPEKLDAIRGQQPINRWAQPSELAEAALFLFSEGASYVIGAALIVDGGYTLR
jgi:NAD(P)-dependent dehydrogenase (short-subunit alcohol dehydrogenase family)